MTSPFAEELKTNAKRICRPGFGILAADESTGTIGKKFAPLGVENTEENRRAYRQLLFSTPDIEKRISGVIMYDETVRQNDAAGVNFCKVLSDKGILPGIKVDKGAVPIMGTEGETATQGLDGLTERCKEYYGFGCRFAKWRGILKIGDGQPTENAVLENTWSLARYASICQMNGLVPIVEPEILADGKHSIETCQAVWERVWSVQIKALIEQNVILEGILLKPNMVTSGLDCPARAEDTVEKVAAAT